MKTKTADINLKIVMENFSVLGQFSLRNHYNVGYLAITFVKLNKSKLYYLYIHVIYANV